MRKNSFYAAGLKRSSTRPLAAVKRERTRRGREREGNGKRRKREGERET